MIALAQFFGLFPIVSIFNNDVNKIKFKLFSIRTVVSLLFIVCAFSSFCLEVSHKIADETINPKSVSGLVFYVMGTLTSILFFRLAFKWNKLLKIIKSTEDSLRSYTLSGWSLDKRIKITSIVLLTAAALENLMATFSYLYDRTIQAIDCNWQIHNWFYYFTSLHQIHVFRIFPTTWYTTLWV